MMQRLGTSLRHLALAAALAWIPLGAAAEPVIQAPTTVPTVSAFIVNVEGLDADDKFAWHSIPQVQMADLVDRSTGRPVLFVSPTQSGMVHLVLAYLDEAGGPRQTSVSITIGGDPPVIPPGPGPEPGPGPDPDPVPPPVEAGKRTVLIVRESAESTPAVARLITALRQPPHATYLTQQGHKLSILDDDSVGPDGQPTPVLESWRPHFAGMTLPVLFVIDQATGQLVHKQSMPADFKAEDVMNLVKEYD